MKLPNEKTTIGGINFDITKQKEIELELIDAKEKAEESDRLKTAFLENMSHEIRTPMNAIMGFSGLLNKPNLADEKRKSYISIVQSSSQQLLSIVSDILTISALVTKQEKPDYSIVCINNVIENLQAIFKQQATKHKIALVAKKDLTDIQTDILTDKTKIIQVLTNLLTNAIKFTHEGGIEFGYNLKNKGGKAELEFYVKDTGIGIEPSLHDKIFERFRQANKSIQVNYGGTGLGLSISKGYVELLGGRIWVESEPGQGSTFYFTIPYKPTSQHDEKNAPTTHSKICRTALVAEDEELNFMLIEEYLSNLDVKLIHAKSGKEAVDFCKSDPTIDLVLMDIKMPIMGGNEAANIIKEFRPNLPIIAQSGFALDSEIEKYGGIFDDYLTKPIREEDIVRVVRKYFKE